MPVVVPYEQQVKVNTQPTVRQDGSTATNAFGSSLGQAIEGAGDQLYRVVQAKQEKDNTKAVLNASNQWNADTMTTFHDPNNGLFTLQGDNALPKPEKEGQPAQLGVTDRAKQYFADSTKKYIDSLDNDIQKIAFMQYVDGRQKQYLQGAMDHEHKQGEIAYEGASLANLKSNEQGFVTARNNTDMADSFLIAGAQNIAIDGKHYGKSPEVVKQEQTAFYSGAIKNSVIAALKENDIAGARQVLSRYKDKLDPDTKAVLDGQIMKVELPIKTRNIANDVIKNFGVTKERDAMDYVNKNYGNDPNYKEIRIAVEGRYVDEKRYVRDEKLQNRKSLSQQIDSAPSLVDAQNIINSAHQSESIDLSEYIALNKMVANKYKVLAGTPTKEQKFFAQYEQTGLYKDENLLDQYEEKLANGEDINEKDLKRYKDASYRRERYRVFSSGGAYNPAQGATEEELKQREADMWNAINTLGDKSVPQEEIINKIKQIAPKYGFDPDYFINNAEWNKPGQSKAKSR